MTPGELLRLARRRHSLTQAEVARRAGTRQPVISAYERDRRDPTMRTLARLIAATGERLSLELATPRPELPPPTSLHEHARHLVDVLELADALPHRRRGDLQMPRMSSR